MERGGGQTGEKRQTPARARNSLVCLEGEESVDEWWKPAGGGSVQVDDFSAPRLYGGGEAGRWFFYTF